MDAFGAFYSSKCSLGGADFADGAPPPVRRRTTARLCRVRFRRLEVRRLLRALDVTKATGPDGISARVLKECAGPLSAPLALLFSLSFSSGVVPSSWKLAHVVPVYKKKAKSSVENYRPISLLAVASKVMETIVNEQIVNFLESQSVFSEHQFGYRCLRGTGDLLAALNTEWTQTVAPPPSAVSGRKSGQLILG